MAHAQSVFTVPKMLGVYFLHHRELLGELIRAETVKERIELLLSWRHSGFSVHNRVFAHPGQGRDLEADAPELAEDEVRLHNRPSRHRRSGLPSDAGGRT